DDSHGIGVVGEHGRGTPEARGVLGRIDILTGTLGKALGGASGGYTAASADIVALLRQRSRPYLFSNALAPPIAAASLVALDLARAGGDLRAALRRSTARFREGMTALGFRVLPGEHPIVPVMVGDARLATQLADRLLALGIYVIGFSFPVVPRGEARIRVQLSAAHTPEHVERALAASASAGRALGAIA
ncbi:MAG: aminotransferase class I/II-fold pyridoxal phosphate-dependent enzyme, partial [Candidatus Limnocylindria bacterium]|nr:aminotransferase class I/II-fold pyridoxal phosphate-dependent enzyme [Candidatus Limnocylindria bacterium]